MKFKMEFSLRKKLPTMMRYVGGGVIMAPSKGGAWTLQGAESGEQKRASG